MARWRFVLAAITANRLRLAPVPGVRAFTAISAVALALLLVADSAVAQQKKPPPGRWAKVAALNGTGAGICNSAGDRYACIALRCGKGRGLEFAFLFNIGDYGTSRTATLSVDGERAGTLGFTAVDRKRELVAPYDAWRHAALLGRLRAGSELLLDLGYKHRFSLRDTGAEIDRTLGECSGDSRAIAVAPAQQPQRTNEAAAHRIPAPVAPAPTPPSGQSTAHVTAASAAEAMALKRAAQAAIDAYVPTQGRYDYRPDLVEKFVAEHLAPPSFGNVDVSGFALLSSTAPNASHFVVSPAHRAAILDLDETKRRASWAKRSMSEAEVLRLRGRFGNLLVDTRRTFGETHPAFAFVLASMPLLRAYLGPEKAEPGCAEMADLYRIGIAAIRNAAVTPENKQHLFLHLADLIEASERDACDTASAKRVGHETARQIAALHLAAGVSPRLPDKLDALARLADDADLRLGLMRLRLDAARRRGDPREAIRGLVDLGIAQHAAGEGADAMRAFKEAFRLYAQRLASGAKRILPTSVGDSEMLLGTYNDTLHDARIRGYPWRTLRELGLTDELDLYVAGLAMEQIVRQMEEDVTSNVGFSWALGAYDLAPALEASRLKNLRDRYFHFPWCAYRVERERNSVAQLASAPSCMSLYSQQRLDAGEYNAAIPVLLAALGIAEREGHQRRTAILLSQLARGYDELGDLDISVGYARRALGLLGSTRMDLSDEELEFYGLRRQLRRIVTKAEREQGRIDNVAATFELDLKEWIDQACEAGTDRFSKEDPFGINATLVDPHVLSNFINRGVVDQYLRCSDKQGVHAFFILAARDDIDSFTIQMSKLKREKDIDKYVAAIRGTRLAGKNEWLQPHLPFLISLVSNDFVRRYVKETNGSPGRIGSIGLELLTLGYENDSARIYNIIKKETHSKFIDNCGDYDDCEYYAYMEDLSGNLTNSAKLYEQMTRRFSDSGMQMDTREARQVSVDALSEGFRHERSGRHRLAEVYYRLARDAVSQVSSGKSGPALASQSDLEFAASFVRVEFGQNQIAAARTLTHNIVADARKKLGGGTVYSADALVRWANRLREVFEIHLDSAPASADGAIAGDEGDFFAFQYLQTTRTAGTIAKIAERTAAGRGAGDVVRRHQDVSARLSNLLGALALAEDDRARSLAARVAALEKEKAAIEAQLRIEAPDYATRLGFRFPTLTETQARLAPGEAVLLSFAGKRHAYLWLVTDRTQRLLRLPLAPAAVEATVRGLRDAVAAWLRDPSAAAFALGAFHEPYRAFLAPFERELAGTERLHFVPNGAFDGLPLSALLERPPPKEAMTPEEMRAARLPWLIRRTAIDVLPSLQSLEVLRQARPVARGEGRPFLGIGNPDFGKGIRTASLARRSAESELIQVPPLPETEAEIRRIGEILGADPARDLLIGAAASEASVRSADLSPYRVVNFATHGILAGELKGVDEPALVLAVPPAPSPDDDGILGASEIATLRLDADLVLLSACNTAASDGRPGAEGLSGLANAFFYAGARTLVVTHWEIPSAPAVQVATGMIEAHAQAGRGDWSAALRDSVLKMIDEGPAAFAHPANWGAHMVVGAARAD